MREGENYYNVLCVEAARQHRAIIGHCCPFKSCLKINCTYFPGHVEFHFHPTKHGCRQGGRLGGA